MEYVWYVIETKCMKDALAARMLRAWCTREGFKVWRPIRRVRVGRGRTRRTIVRSQIPGYVLLRMPVGTLSPSVWRRVSGTAGVHGWLSSRPDEPPRVVSDSEMRVLRMAFITKARKVRELKKEGLSPGDIVCVVNKLLNDLFGSAIARIVSIDNRSRARILFDTMGAVVPLTIKTTDLRRIPAQAA